MTDTPHSLIQRFEASARSDFERRLGAVRDAYLRFLTHRHRDPGFDVRELSAELLTMGEDERFALLRHVARDTAGPATLEGLEALRSFVANYMLDDAVATVVPEPGPANLDDDPGFATLLDFVRGDDEDGLDEAALRARAVALHEARERPLTLVPARDGERAAGPAEVLAAIRHNRDFERRRAAEFEAFMEDAPAPFAP